ncbi:hypothetical protein DLJ53_31735 [Acuticoccus sediminis]|uniref:ABC transmembrane type-1 domain-containing protein n=1 Tax=Acuticoccus sediminis TaxID=2184697 RepID=A0A8B2NPW2_9HYPH|nr:hypothetical protein DLJ53_31735 [Acuticoccus sediminis]
MAKSGDIFAPVALPFEAWVNDSFMWLSLHWRPFFQLVREPLAAGIEFVSAALVGLPAPLVLAALFLGAWQLNGVTSAVFLTTLAFLVGVIGIWTEMMETLALIGVAVLLCLAVGLPVGLAAARSERLDNAIRPVLDLMQTLPAFVYLVPIVLLVGVGDLPGVLVTFVFAVPLSSASPASEFAAFRRRWSRPRPRSARRGVRSSSRSSSRTRCRPWSPASIRPS